MIRWTACAVVGWLAGCGPSLHGLVAGHHYREAICGAHDGRSGDRERVGRALDADAGVLVHLHAVPTTALQAVLGDATASVTARARFVRIAVQTNWLPVDDIQLRAGIHDGQRSVATSVTWGALAAITGERLPAQHPVTTYATSANALRGLAALLTIGTSLLFTPFQRREVLVDAPDAAYQAMAPRAHALFHAMAPAHCGGTSSLDDGVHARCTAFLVVAPRGPQAKLSLSVRYLANRRSRGGEALPETCVVERTATVDLGRLDDLDATVGRMFANPGAGTTMRGVLELGASPTGVASGHGT